MGFIHEVDGPIFGLEERRESFVITFASNHEIEGVFIYDEEHLSGGIELSLERIAELKTLLEHPSIDKKLYLSIT